MTRSWVAECSDQYSSQLTNLRSHRDVEVLVHGTSLWTKGNDYQAVEAVLLTVPGMNRFDVSENGELIPIGCRVPCGTVPSGEWTRLADWYEIVIPTSQIPGNLTKTMQIAVVRGGIESEPNGILMHWTEWHEFVISTLSIRHSSLMFAVNERHEVFVKGTPLPAVNGHLYVISPMGVAVPAGFELSPRIGCDIIRQLNGATEHDVLVFYRDCSADVIAGNQFVAATRSAVRATTEHL